MFRRCLGLILLLSIGCDGAPEDLHAVPDDDDATDDDDSVSADDDSVSDDDDSVSDDDAGDDDSSPPGTCPSGMVHVQGGTFSLGEWDADQITGFASAEIIAQATFVIDAFCIDEYPFPGPQGGEWPVDGLDAEDAVAFETLVTPHGRRLCGIVEMLLAGAGPDNWRYPYDPMDWIEGTCPPDDSDPGPMGSYPGCVSPLGIHDFMVRSTWGRLDCDELREACGVDEGGADHLPLEGQYAVWGGTSRPNTFYAPSNFGVHFHEPGTSAFQDDGVRTCATPWTSHDDDGWSSLVDEFRTNNSFETLLHGRAPQPDQAPRRH